MALTRALRSRSVMYWIESDGRTPSLDLKESSHSWVSRITPELSDEELDRRWWWFLFLGFGFFSGLGDIEEGGGNLKNCGEVGVLSVEKGPGFHLGCLWKNISQGEAGRDNGIEGMFRGVTGKVRGAGRVLGGVPVESHVLETELLWMADNGGKK
jgi:hypothetical protein